MKRRGEEEPDTGLRQTALDHGRRRRYPDPQGLVHVGTTGATRGGSIAVLRHAHAARRHHNGDARRNVEGRRSIAAGTAAVEDAVVAARQRHGMAAHGPRQPDDLGGTLALHRQPDEKGADVRRGGGAGHDFLHGGAGFVGRQILVTNQLVDQGREHG